MSLMSQKIEDDQHILSVCTMNKKLIQEQHNRLVNEIDKKLKDKFPETKVQIEQSWRRGTKLIKPDVATIYENKGHCVIVKLTCPYDLNKDYFQQRRSEKEKKYRSLTLGEL